MALVTLSSSFSFFLCNKHSCDLSGGSSISLVFPFCNQNSSCPKYFRPSLPTTLAAVLHSEGHLPLFWGEGADPKFSLLIGPPAARDVDSE